jgi:hypothetical protein
MLSTKTDSKNKLKNGCIIPVLGLLGQLIFNVYCFKHGFDPKYKDATGQPKMKKFKV